MYYYQQRISLREIKRLHEQNLIIDAKDGGLLLGPSHKEGGIYFYLSIRIVLEYSVKLKVMNTLLIRNKL